MLWKLTSSAEQKPSALLELKLHGEAMRSNNSKRIWVPGPLIIGAGPSGLAIAACLKEKGVPSLILEKENCIASSWRMRTYERLKLHIPKHFCELPLMPFPPDFPVYPTKQQFISYLDSYIKHFSIRPFFRMEVQQAEYDHSIGFWRIKADGEWEFICRWLIVATGENAEAMVPEITGMTQFKGRLLHTSCYKNGDDFRGERVLVVGCGNSGMEVCLDLCNNHAQASLVVRDELHILPREVLGISTFRLSMWLLRWLPVKVADRFLLLCARLILGGTEKHGLRRPKIGPLQLKNTTGKTPVLDIGALSKIKSGQIKEEEFFCKKNGFPKTPFPNSWRGENGLYATGFTRRGLLGASIDAHRIAEDVACQWNSKTKHLPMEL